MRVTEDKPHLLPNLGSVLAPTLYPREQWEMSSKDEDVFWPILYLPLVKFQGLRGEEVQCTNIILSASMTQSRASPLPVGPDLPRERESDS